jgi:hypothetical protein
MREFKRTKNTVKGTVRGQWLDKEKRDNVPDDSIEFVVAVPPDQIPQLDDLFEEICTQFDQKCIYFTIGGDAFLFHPTKERNRETDPEKA